MENLNEESGTTIRKIESLRKNMKKAGALT
jgi:hypothetical protein